VNTATLVELERDAVLLPDTGRELIVATGADRVRFLHGIVTADVTGAAPGQGRRSVLLTPKGHLVAEMEMFVRADAIWIVVGPGLGAEVAGALSRYAIMDDFAAAVRPDITFASLLGPSAPARLAAIGLAPGAVGEGPPRAHADVGALWVARMRELGHDGLWLAGERATMDAVRDQLLAAGVRVLPAALAEAARIVAIEPRAGAEITADYFPMEAGLNDAIDYSKGCYLGQEPIVRIRDRGHINWRLCGLDLDGAVDAHPGDLLESDTKPKAGRVTSAARLPDGRGVALAMVHVSVPVGGAVRIRRGDATIAARVRAEA
jgi:tRNA-modifying protein YgfZ